MQHPYTVQLSYKARKGVAFRGFIMENDVAIGRCWRGAIHDGYVPPIEYTFFSSQARNRFDDFANCLSIGETIEALLPLK